MASRTRHDHDGIGVAGALIGAGLFTLVPGP